MSLRLFLEQTITQSEGSMGKANSKSFCRLSVMLRHLLVPFSWIFGLVVSCRNGLYDLGWWRPKRLPGQVISVGNITVGGTGKTPMTIHLTKAAKARGFKPGIVSRGYGRSSHGLQIIHDGNRNVWFGMSILFRQSGRM